MAAVKTVTLPIRKMFRHKNNKHKVWSWTFHSSDRRESLHPAAVELLLLQTECIRTQTQPVAFELLWRKSVFFCLNESTAFRRASVVAFLADRTENLSSTAPLWLLLCESNCRFLHLKSIYCPSDACNYNDCMLCFEFCWWHTRNPVPERILCGHSEEWSCRATWCFSSRACTVVLLSDNIQLFFIYLSDGYISLRITFNDPE